jgi:hypothetical protein
MMKDLASVTSYSRAEFTADSYLMRNCLEFPKPLYFGRETGLNFGGHGAVCSPMDNGDSKSTNCQCWGVSEKPDGIPEHERQTEQ